MTCLRDSLRSNKCDDIEQISYFTYLVYGRGEDLSPFVCYLVKTGSSQYFFWSPKTCAIFFLKPSEKPFLSEPVRKTGARKASAEEDH